MPSVDAKKNSTKTYPQAQNQIAIYNQLEDWLKHDKIKTVLGEGCSGPIDDAFASTFNGWNMKNLRKRVPMADYAEVLTHIPLKLKAKYASRVEALCAEDTALVKSHALAFSDARGNYGYYSRISQHKDDAKRVKPYLDDVINLLKLSPKAMPADALARLKTEILAALDRIRKGFGARDAMIVKSISKIEDRELALVIGGAHAGDLVEQLRKAKIDCTVVEPVGYKDDAEKLVAELTRLSKTL